MPYKHPSALLGDAVTGYTGMPPTLSHPFWDADVYKVSSTFSFIAQDSLEGLLDYAPAVLPPPTGAPPVQPGSAGGAERYVLLAPLASTKENVRLGYDNTTQEYVVIKQLKRRVQGMKLEYHRREVANHMRLGQHPRIIQFR